MTVRKVFWEDPYQTTIDTTVTCVEGNVITLAQTIFYAFSGGQHSDRGTIGGYEVLKAEKDGKEILYTIPENHTLKAGDCVRVQVDWNVRYRLMKLHFAAELVLEVINQNYRHPEKTGANISPDKARIDFVWDGPITSILPDVSERVAKLIGDDLPIVSAFENESEQCRYWQIDGFAKVLCGGTHPRRTGEIGDLRLKRKNIGKGVERIEITLAEND